MRAPLMGSVSGPSDAAANDVGRLLRRGGSGEKGARECRKEGEMVGFHTKNLRADARKLRVLQQVRTCPNPTPPGSCRTASSRRHLASPRPRLRTLSGRASERFRTLRPTYRNVPGLYVIHLTLRADFFFGAPKPQLLRPTSSAELSTLEREKPGGAFCLNAHFPQVS